MNVEVEHGPAFARARCFLNPGESVDVEPGAMAAQSLGIQIESSLGSGGAWGALKRKVVGGESLFTSKFTAPKSPGKHWVDLVPTYPGDIAVMTVEPNAPIILTRECWLGSSPTVSVDAKFGGAKMFLGGEGLWTVRCSGQGQVILAAYGGLDVHELGPGEGVTVDTGHVVAYEDGMQINMRKAGTGLINSVTSKEGIVMDFMGPGTVITQTRNPSAFSSWVASLLPSSGGNSSNNSGGGGFSLNFG